MRLLTRSDFDGLGCAVLLRDMWMLNSIKFVHPKDIQDGKEQVTDDDILANIPYVPGCGLWFDHHSSESQRQAYGEFKGKSDPKAPSAAHVVYDYFGGRKTFVNSHIDDLLAAVDKADSGNFTIDEVLSPRGWPLISFIMDPRTGLGRYKDYRISNYQLMMDMIDYCRKMTAEQILDIEDVKERTRRYFEQDDKFRQMVCGCADVRGDAVVVDLRDEDEIYTGNRFVTYSLFPDQNISVQVMWGLHKKNVVITCGHSIINRTSQVDVGKLMLKYNGGGHKRVGTCQVATELADTVLEAIINEINETSLKPQPSAG